MAEISIYLGGTIFAVYATLRIARFARTQSKRRADERLKDHLKWSRHKSRRQQI